MEESKLIQHLRILKPTEVARFEKFVHSPFFHQHLDTIRLFEYLKDYFPNFEGESLKKNTVFEALYPSEPFDAARLYTLSKYLLQLLLQFLEWEGWQNQHPAEKALVLMEEMQRRKLDKFIPRVWVENWSTIESSNFRNAEFALLELKYRELQISLDLSHANRSNTTSYLPVSESLDHYYMLQKLRFAAAIISRGQVVNMESDIPLLNEILAYCENLELSQYPVLQIYYLGLKITLDPQNIQFFNQLDDSVKNHSTLLHREERFNLYTLLVNYCTRQYRQGKMDFLGRMFALYKRMIEEGILFPSTDPLTGTLYFKNIVTLGLKLDELEWTENFIKKYHLYLASESRTTIYHLSLANLHFQRQAYGKSLKSLQKVDFIDPYLRLNYDKLLMKTYYECDEIEALLSLCNSFSMYIRRNKVLSAVAKEGNLRFASLIRKLIRIKEGRKERLEKFKLAFFEEKPLDERNWLEAKLNELEVEKA